MLISILIGAGFLLPCRGATVKTPEPIAPIPMKSGVDPARAAIGSLLFHDVRLSKTGSASCATCHPLDRGGMDGSRVSRRPDGTAHQRNTPTVFNAVFNATLNWDGVAHALEPHADRIIQGLMGLSWEELIARLRSDSRYVATFGSSYKEGITRASILDSLAEFERSLITPNCRFDRFLRGDTGALTEREVQGYQLFKRLGCITCHQGVNAGGNLYQKFGVFEEIERGKASDPGRIRITNVSRDRGVFRVPGLRNVAVTAPYFHDGREPDLKEAVKTMGRVQLGRTLASDQIEMVVEFLQTLTGEFRGERLKATATEAKP